MKWFVSISVLMLICGFALAEKTFFYHEYNEKTGEINIKFSRHIKELPPDKIEVTTSWQNENDTSSGTDVSILDAKYATLQWKVTDPDKNTDYAGERKGNRLLIKGTHNGKAVDKNMKIDDLPFFHNPGVGLEEFVRSGKKKMDFRTIRPDKLSEHKMKAENKGTKTITVNGKPIEAIQVKWGLTGLLSKFYSQKHWFRKSDGVFVKSEPSYDRFSELISEQ